MNKVVLIGRLTNKPEIRDGNKLATFNLAVNKNLSKQKRQELEQADKATADFIRIQVWGAMAENCYKYLDKGSQCAIAGRIQTGSYENSQGQRIYTTDVVAENVEFLSSNNNKNSNSKSQEDIDDFFGNDFTEIKDDNKIPF